MIVFTGRGTEWEGRAAQRPRAESYNIHIIIITCIISVVGAVSILLVRPSLPARGPDNSTSEPGTRPSRQSDKLIIIIKDVRVYDIRAASFAYRTV